MEVDSSSNAAANAQRAEAARVAQQQQAQQAQQQQAQQAQAQQQQQQQAQARSGNPTTSADEVSARQSPRLEAGREQLNGQPRGSSAPALPPASPVQDALGAAENRQANDKSPQSTQHLKDGDARPAKGSVEAQERAKPMDQRAPSRFDTVAARARADAGIGPKSSVIKQDAAGTAAEFRSPNRNAINFDGPHPSSDGQAHNRPHVGVDTTANGGSKTNVPYEAKSEDEHGPKRIQPKDPKANPTPRVDDRAAPERPAVRNGQTAGPGSETEKNQANLRRMAEQDAKLNEARNTPPAQRTLEQRQLMSRMTFRAAARIMRLGGRGTE